MSNEIVPVEARPLVDTPVLAREPEAVLEAASRAAKALQGVIESRKDKIEINGKVYLRFEDWQTISEFYRYGVRVHSAEPIKLDDVKGFKAKADVLDLATGVIVGGAESYCMRDEERWRDRPSFMLASMAQTRAGAKALRTRLAWVAVLAGYEATPAEEMEETRVETPRVLDPPRRGRPPKELSSKAQGPVNEGLKGNGVSPDKETQGAWDELSDAFLRHKASGDQSLSDEEWWSGITRYEKVGTDGKTRVWEQKSMGDAEAFWHETYRRFGNSKNVFVWLKNAKKSFPHLFEKQGVTNAKEEEEKG